MIDLPLYPVPSADWQERYNRLSSDPWIQRKTDRERRIREHQDYIDAWCPELRTAAPGLVVDLGCGCGELLEIARSHGHQVLGVDSDGINGMGASYVLACRMMQERQRIAVYGRGFEAWLKAVPEPSPLRGTCALINSRGSFEQMHARFMTGERHDFHHDCKRLRWRIDTELLEHFAWMFTVIEAMLRPGGAFLIVANGAANGEEISEPLKAAAEQAGLKLAFNPMPTIHKWTKPV